MCCLPLDEFQGVCHLFWVFDVNIKQRECLAQGHDGGGDVIINNFLIHSNLELSITLHKQHTGITTRKVL